MAASLQRFCMIGGDGETSYANNSQLQAGMQSKLKPLVEEAIADLCRAGVPGHVRVADLGCSSGPNALVLMSAAVEAVCRRSHHRKSGDQEPCRCRPEISVYLNDLPDNDFNLVFRAVPSFLDKHMPARAGTAAETNGVGGPPPLVQVFAAPGSFYGRLFPTQTLHLVCSSFSVHWLSKVPQELVDGVLINKGNIIAGRTSTPAVCAAYAKQFEQDFRVFLAARAQEMIPGGWMVLCLIGRPTKDFSSKNMHLEFATQVLHDMVSQGVISAEEVDSYNVPFYAPCEEELRAVAELEGSFDMAGRMESHEVLFCDGDASKSAAMARSLRAIFESTLVQHFLQADHDVGEEFARAAEARYRGPPTPVIKGFIHVISLKRK